MSTFARIPGASRRFQPTACAVAIALIGSAALAQPATERSLPGIVITGSPIIESNNLDGFAGLSTRVTDSQVRDLGALDLAAALRLTPGVQISRYNEVGSYSGDQGGNVTLRVVAAPAKAPCLVMRPRPQRLRLRRRFVLAASSTGAQGLPVRSSI